MPREVLELMIPAFERAKTVHALDRAATLIGIMWSCNGKKDDGCIIIASIRGHYSVQADRPLPSTGDTHEGTRDVLDEVTGQASQRNKSRSV
jgi:hypothetical protein